jgi:medium-chain acyl-[acyl-carrier-protein] hydrolase
MYYVQETTIRHTDCSPLPMKWYMNNRWAWIITNWLVKVFSYPRFGEKVKITTFPTRFKGLFSERWFEAFDERGELVALAYSNWMLVDLNNMKPIRPSNEIMRQWGDVLPEPADRRTLYRALDPDAERFVVSQREYIVTRRDLDANNHVNNAKYIEWAFDDVEDEYYRRHKTAELKAVYRQQCFKGDKITINYYRYKAEPDALATIFKNADGVVLAEIYSHWKECSDWSA